MKGNHDRARGNFEMGDPLPSIFAPIDMAALEERITEMLSSARAADAPASFNVEGITAESYEQVRAYCSLRNVAVDFECEQGRAPWLWIHADRGTYLDCDPETEAFLTGLNIAERSSAGSSVKFLEIARGRADVYPRFGPTMEWDTAAGQAVLEASGGRVVDAGGARFRYGKTQDGLRNSSFVAWGRQALTDR